ncbi:MAG: hypothetical protein KGL39_41600 [Patescibacteria group bacterium]|nr:hypothetical protein [Patescibacteria group bacterium]
MVKQVPLSQGKVAVVDDEDYERVLKYKWHVRKSVYSSGTVCWYAATNIRSDKFGKRTILLLHRFIAGVGCSIDHADADGLNNTRKNLRPCNQSQNVANGRKRTNSTSGYKGVSWERRRKHWRAYIVLNNKQKYLGQFATPEEAARAYDAAATELFGIYARLNFSAI